MVSNLIIHAGVAGALLVLLYVLVLYRMMGGRR
jgi:preprotein translocase subunit SecD